MTINNASTKSCEILEQFGIQSFVKENNGSYTINQPVTADEIINYAKYLISEKYQRAGRITNSKTAEDYFIAKLATLEDEHFCALFLDVKNDIIAFEVLSIGTLMKAEVYPRTLLKKSLQHNAAAIILGHNHPSGQTEPSNCDIKVTKNLKNALSLFDIEILDHIIVGGASAVSMSGSGLMPNLA